MHELSLAESVLDLVRQHVPPSDGARVRGIRVRIGEASGVQGDALAFCFGAVVAGTPFAGAFIEIEPVAAEGVCGGCRAQFSMRLPVAACPQCGSTMIRQTGGHDLQVVDVTLDDTNPAQQGVGEEITP